MSFLSQIRRGRLIGSAVVVFGLFVALPAASQAIVAVNPGSGIAGAGTVTGTWTSGQFSGQSQTLQVASVIECILTPAPTSFDASWTDPSGASHFFKFDNKSEYTTGCDYPNGFNNPPQFAHLSGPGSSSGLDGAPTDNSSVDESMTGPAFSSPPGPNTMYFTLTTPEGKINVSPQFPGRIQVFGGAPSAT